TDVERPHLAGALLELTLEAQPVHRLLAEDGKQGVTDAHDRIRTRYILSTILSMYGESIPSVRPIRSPVAEHREHDVDEHRLGRVVEARARVLRTPGRYPRREARDGARRPDAVGGGGRLGPVVTD